MAAITVETKIDLIGVPIGMAQLLLAGLDYIPMPGVQRDPVKIFIQNLMMEAERAAMESPPPATDDGFARGRIAAFMGDACPDSAGPKFKEGYADERRAPTVEIELQHHMRAGAGV